MNAPGLRRDPERPGTVKRYFPEPVGDSLDATGELGAAPWIAVGVRRANVQIFEEVGSHEFDHLEGQAARWAGKCVLPAVLFTVRGGLFHAGIIGQTFGTSKSAFSAGLQIALKLTLYEK